MTPTLEPGDFVLLKHSTTPVPDGAIVVARHPLDPSLLIVKRSRALAAGYWLTSDNESDGSDSRYFGPVPASAVLGPVTMVLDHPRRPITSPMSTPSGGGHDRRA
ncbi:MAG: S26 family signal peptidase [Acidimicrobiia bacterium]|nr:S26 family signal peptidase [Acidimicrobiia bacterium]